MSTIGMVSQLVGRAVAVKADGSERVLAVGDEIQADELIRVSPDGSIEIKMEGGDPVNLEGGQSWLATAETYQDAEQFDTSEAVADIQSIQEAILAGADPTEVAEATAAGAEGSPEGNEGSSTVNVDRTAAEVDPTAGYDTTGISDSVSELLSEELSPVILAPPSVATLAGEMTLEDSGTALITASVDNAPLGDLILTLSTGDVLIIPAGETSGEVEVDINNDEDIYLDSSQFTVAISSFEGGNYESLDTTDTAAVVVLDTIDTVTVSLAATEELIEGDVPGIEYTAVLTGGVANNDITVTLQNGEVIIIPAGETSGSTTTFSQGDDVYLDSGVVTNSIASAVEDNAGTPGALENLVIDGSNVETFVDDTTDNTLLTLDDLTVNEGAGEASISAQLSAAPIDGPVVFTLTNGATITFAVGETTASSTPFPVQGDDVYIDGESFTVSVESFTGGSEYENLVTTDTAEVIIEDTIDDTTLTLNDVVVDEGVGTTSISAELSAAPTAGPVVFTLSNGATITFGVGQTVATSTEFAIQGDDVYIDGENYTVSVDSFTGGAEYENLVTSDTAEVTVEDTIDDTILTLNDPAVNEESGIATISAELTAAPTDAPLVVSLSNGATITFAIGQTTATSTVFTLEGGEISVTGYTGGSEYENLVISGSSIVVDSTPEISDLTPAIEGGDVVVDEDDLPDGSDGTESVTQPGTFTVTSPNGVETLTVGSLNVVENGTYQGDGINFTTPEGHTFTVTGYNATSGLVSYTFTLNENESHDVVQGENSFFENLTVYLEDSDGDFTTDVLSARIVDDVAEAVDDEVSTNEDTPIIIDVLANDAEGADGASVTSVTQPANGVVEINDDGTLTFTPAANLHGQETFTYTLTDGDGDTSTATVTVNVEAVADSPNLIVSVTEVSADPGSEDEIVSTSITSDNLSGEGFTVEALNPDGSPGTISTNSSPVGFGVVGRTDSGANSEIGLVDGQSEAVRVTFDEDISEVDVVLGWNRGGANSEYAEVTFFKDGAQVGDSVTLQGITDKIDDYGALSPTVVGALFDQIVLSASGIDDGDDDFVINSITFDTLVEGEPGSYTYDVNVQSSLSDVDGSETLGTVSFSSLPAGVTFDGSTLTSTTPLTETQINSITASVTSTETSNGDTATTVTNAKVEFGSLNATGESADLLIEGDALNNPIVGGDGDDIIFGRAGDDSLEGGAGDDMFVWEGSDVGTVGSPAHDTVTDFNTAEDVLNLTDLLSDGSHTIEGIDNGSGELQVNIKDTNGDVVQEIELSGVSVAGDAADTLQTLLDTGAIDDGI